MPQSPDEDPATGISNLTGEFRDREIEGRFRQDQLSETISSAKFLFALGIFVSVVFFVADGLLAQWASWLEMAIPRGGTLAVSLVCYLLIDRLRPAMVQALIVAWEATIILSSAALVTIHPAIAVASVFLVSALLYLVIPTGFRTTIAMGIAGSTVMFAAYAGFDQLVQGEITVAVALMLTNMLLAILKSRSGQLLRKAWATANNYRKTLDQLNESQCMLQRTFMAVPTPLVVSAIDSGVITRANQAAENFFNLSSRSLAGRTALEFYADPSARSMFTDMLRNSGVVRGFRTQLRTADGTRRSVMLSASRAGGAEDEPATEIVTSMLDLSEIESRERGLQAAKEEYQALFENSIVGIYRSTLDGKMLRANPALVRFNGYASEAELIAAVDDIALEWYVQPGRREQWLHLMRDHGRVTDFVSEVYRHSNREPVWISENSWTVFDQDGEPLYFEGTLIEATDRKRAEAEFQHMASHDQLTNLANRWLLTERLEQAASWVQRYGGQFAMLCLDLDRFKPVNDAFGHATGDMLLQEAAQRLKSVCRTEDTVARLGGDEFAILSTRFGGPQELAAIAQKVLEVFSTPFVLDGPRAMIGASIGIAIAPADGTDARELLARADEALYRAKADGRNTYRFANPEFDTLSFEKTAAGA